jgi:hypothetical protein
LQVAKVGRRGLARAGRAAARMLQNAPRMIDLGLLLLTAAFFGLSFLYVRVCARL